ncbi:MAG: recombinase family protein [Paraclostridium sp.]
MKRVVAYVRVSSASQIDNTSIDLQIEKIQLHCKLHDIEIVQIFKDEGLSAKSIERQAYNDMIEFIKNKDNAIDSVIAYKSDRVHRSLKNLLIFIEDVLNPLKIGFLSVTEQFDTSSPQGMLFLQMLGSFSEFERKIINERTKSGRVKKGKDELYAGGRVPFGYKLIDNDTLVINQEEAQIVKEIFKLRCKGKSYNYIATKFNISKQRARYIVNNKIYVGKYNYDGLVEQNKINFDVPRIVTNYTYTKANSIKIK